MAKFGHKLFIIITSFFAINHFSFSSFWAIPMHSWIVCEAYFQNELRDLFLLFSSFLRPKVFLASLLEFLFLYSIVTGCSSTSRTMSLNSNKVNKSFFSSDSYHILFSPLKGSIRKSCHKCILRYDFLEIFSFIVTFSNKM